MLASYGQLLERLKVDITEVGRRRNACKLSLADASTTEELDVRKTARPGLCEGVSGNRHPYAESKSKRNPGMRIIPILVIIFVLCGVGAFAAPQPPFPIPLENSGKKQTDTKHSDQAAESEKNIKYDGPITVKILPASDADAKAAKQEKYEEEKAANDCLIAWSTAFLALVTTALAFFTAYLWRATSRLVRGSEKTAERQLRAYVLTKFGAPMTLNSNGCLYASIITRNFGQTPAYEMTTFLEITLDKFPLDVELNASTRLPGTSKSIIAPSDEVSHFITYPSPLSQTEEAAIVSRKYAIYVYGTLLYTDAFSQKRHTRFCVYSTGVDFNRGNFVYCCEGNEAN